MINIDNIANNEKITSNILFDEIMKVLETKGKLPKSLNYAEASESDDYFMDEHMQPLYRFVYDKKGVVFLAVYVECNTNKGDCKLLKLGTFITKDNINNDDAMLEFGVLAGNFTIELRNYIKENRDRLTWRDANVYFYKTEDNYIASVTAPNDIAFKMAKVNKDAFAQIIVRDNYTRELFYV